MTRNYYLRAEPVQWDYAPTLKTDMTGNVIPYSNTIIDRVLYFQYSDETYTTRVPQPDHYGDLGPPIRANVGDVIKVHLANMSSRNVSIHPHGVQYDQAGEGMADQAVPPGGNRIFTWRALERSGPAEGKQSKLWAYHSHVTENDVYTGLVGPIVIYSNLTPWMPNEIFVKSIIDIYESDPREVYAINGYIFGNLPNLNVTLQEPTIWYLISFGNEEDIHAMHWHANVVLDQYDHYVDVLHLLPASFETVTMTADSPGSWLYHCHVIEHFEKGMYAYYTVS